MGEGVLGFEIFTRLKKSSFFNIVIYKSEVIIMNFIIGVWFQFDDLIFEGC